MALLVDGVTKLTKMSFKSSEEEQAENFRKMIVAMAKDIRVILIKLADRLHNMRTLCYLGKEKQIQKAKETLEIYAPLAHRLGIESVRWELEDLAFAPSTRASTPRSSRWSLNAGPTARSTSKRPARTSKRELEKVKIDAEISGRAKHFYSIYDKMTRKGKEFNEIYDLTALRVLVRLGKDCYAAAGHHPLAVEAAARALQGLHRHAQVQHVPVAAHHGHRTAGQAARDPDPHHRDA